MLTTVNVKQDRTPVVNVSSHLPCHQLGTWQRDVKLFKSCFIAMLGSYLSTQSTTISPHSSTGCL